MKRDYIHMVPDYESKTKVALEFERFYTDMISASPMELSELRRYFEKWGICASEPEKVDYQVVDANGVECMWAIPHGCAEDRVLIAAHGGAYQFGSMYASRKSYSHMAKSIGCRGLIVNYHLTPEYPWPTPLEDMMKVYEWLLENGYEPEHIAITGDSCGGALSLSVPLTIKERGLPMLAASMPISPWLDTMATSETYENNQTDILNSREWVRPFGEGLKANGINVKDPHLAPMYLKPEQMMGFPPIYIQTGGYETLVGEAVVLADIANQAGVPVKLDLVGHMQHSFHQMAGNNKDADLALKRFSAWVQPILGLKT
ncbi:MAG: alpha/beta hydrolase [Lachnospiraceae bacterium]|nr:alpha/beta hydrolase [Lachnospiraceae bacterium]